MKKLIITSLFLFFLTGCGAGQIMDGPDMIRSYAQISREEAVKLMQNEKDYVILDVRTADEYESGHIPGAICIPNEQIGNEEIPELPDKNQLILIYCRTGRRSKEAAQKLFEMGYSNVREFGGINDWEGETVTGP